MRRDGRPIKRKENVSRHNPYYNWRVSFRQLFVGDILREKQIRTLRQDEEAISEKGRPYKVIVIPHYNAYVLEDDEGKKLKNAFNMEHSEKKKSMLKSVAKCIHLFDM